MKMILFKKLAVLICFTMVFSSCNDSLWGDLNNPVDPQNTGSPVSSNGIILNLYNLYLTTGSPVQLIASMSDGSSSSGLLWSSYNNTVATVDQSGWVTGVNPGTADIHVSTYDGSRYADCFVSVSGSNAPISGITLNAASLVLRRSSTYQLTAITTSGMGASSVTWASSDSTVATVSSSGLVTCIAEGSAVITATTTVGYYTAICTLTVDNFPFNSTSFTGPWGGSDSIIGMSSDGMKLAYGGYSSSLYMSSDGGLTWTPQNSLGSRNWGAVSMSGNGQTIAAYVSNGFIFRSTDGGTTWSACTGPGSASWASIAVSANGPVIAVCANTGYIYTSSDSGASWTKQTAAGSRAWSSISVSSDGSRMLAGVCDPSGSLYYSANAGASWTALSTPVTGYWYRVAISRDGSSLFGFCNNAVYRSTDGGSTWTMLDGVNTLSSNFAVSQDGSRIASMNGSTFYVSTDSGSTWTSASRSGITPGNLCMTADGKVIKFFYYNTMYSYTEN